MAKKRVSLTLEEKLVEQLDSEADKEGLNRSSMVEKVLEEYFRSRSVSTAVILCGGEGKKSLEEHGSKPVLEHILENIGDEGISRAILLIGRNEEIRESYGSSFDGMAIEYVEEEDPSGTAAALRKVEGKVDHSFVLLNGHVVSEVDLEEMLQIHREQEVTATMALKTVEDPSSYGVARLKGNKILGFEEKPEEGEEPSRLINAGTYIIEPSIFEDLAEDSLENTFKRLASSRDLAGYIYGGDWMEIDH